MKNQSTSHTVKYGIYLLFLFMAITCISCESDERDLRVEEQEIEDYIAAHTEFSFEQKESGLYYADIVVGDGVMPETGDRAYVRYTGTFVDGTEFDSNETVDDGGVYTKSVFRFYVDKAGVIDGFNECVKYMHEGGEAIVIIPSALGYGNINSNFDPYTPLIFTVKLTSVVQF